MWTDTQFATLWYTRDGFHHISTLPASATIISSAVVTETSFDTPVYQISKPGCSTTCWATAPRCYVDASGVELLYWPMTPASGYPNDTVVSNATEVVTAIFEGLTITSPTVVLSYGAIYATDDCGSTLGGVYPGRLLTLHPDSVSSLYVQGGPPQHGSPFRFNFEDLNIPHPLSVQLKQCWPTPVELCGLEDAAPYNPILADPPEIIGLDPAWENCGKPLFGTHDPPRILTPAQALVNPTPVADARTNPTAAIPASSFPSPAVASSTEAYFVSSPSKSLEKSAVPYSVPGRPLDITQSKGSNLEQGPNTKSAQKKPSHQNTSRTAAAIADPSRTDIDPSPIELAPTGPSARASPLSTPTHYDPAAPGTRDRDSPSINASPVEPPVRGSTLPTPSTQLSFRQDLPDQNNPMTDIIASKSPENPNIADPLASRKIPENTPLGKDPSPSSPLSDPIVKVAAKVQDFIVAIGSSATLAPYDGKSVATVLGQVISLLGSKGIVVDGTKTVRFAAFQTPAGSYRSDEQSRATTGGGDVDSASDPAPSPATSLPSAHLVQVNSATVGNEIFSVRTDKDQPTTPSIMTIQGEAFHEAGVLVLTKSNPSLAAVIPSIIRSATLTGSRQILTKTKSIVLNDGSGIPISTLAVVHLPLATTNTIPLPFPGATKGGNTAIPSIITLGSHTIFSGMSQDIVVQEGKTVTLTRSSRIIGGEGRPLPSLEIVLDSSSTTAQASLPGESESTKGTGANAPTPTIMLKELRLAELIMKGFGVGASTTSGGSSTTVVGAERNESSKYVNNTSDPSDRTIANEEEVAMIGRGGRMKTTGWGVGLAAFSIMMGMWMGIGMR